MEAFKQRASGAGVLMTSPRLKKDKEAGVLSKTIQTSAQMWLKERLYGRRKEFNSRYTEKGTIVESASLRWVARHIGLGLVLETNDQFFADDFFTGTPDLITNDTVFDLKNSWDFTTFPLFGTDVDKAYYYQLQVYMHLTGKRKASLVYILSNTPRPLIDRELKYKMADLKSKGISFSEKDLDEELTAFHTYDNIPPELRIKRYDFEYNHECIEIMKERVLKVREYLNQLDEGLRK